MRKLVLSVAVLFAVPGLAQDAHAQPVGEAAVGAVPVAPVRVPTSQGSPTRLTASDVVPTSRATEAFEWQPRPVTKFDLARRARVEKLTVRQALDAFYAQSNTVGLQDKWPDISAYFEVHPTSMKVAYDELHAKKMEINAIVPFYMALGKARVTEARELLLSIVRDTNDTPMDRTRAIFALVDREDTGVELAEELSVMSTVEATTHNAQFLKGEAVLGLSMMAGVKRRQPELREVSAKTIRSLLATGDVNDQRIAMKAIGNMADSTLLPLAVQIIKAADPYVRMEAAYAFRRLNPRFSEELVLGWLATEKHPFVKAKIYQIAQLQHFDLHTGASEAMSRQAIKDMPGFTSGVDRRTVVRLLGQSKVKNESWVREALVAQARFENKKNTGYLNEFAEILTPAEMWEVIR